MNINNIYIYFLILFQNVFADVAVHSGIAIIVLFASSCWECPFNNAFMPSIVVPY